jgi:hypothetical protein
MEFWSLVIVKTFRCHLLSFILLSKTCQFYGKIGTITIFSSSPICLSALQLATPTWSSAGWRQTPVGKSVVQVVAMDSLKFHPGPPCPTLLCPAGGPSLKQPLGYFRGGQSAGRAACSRLLPFRKSHAILLWQGRVKMRTVKANSFFMRPSDLTCGLSSPGLVVSFPQGHRGQGCILWGIQ